MLLSSFEKMTRITSILIHENDNATLNSSVVCLYFVSLTAFLEELDIICFHSQQIMFMYTQSCYSSQQYKNFVVTIFQLNLKYT